MAVTSGTQPAADCRPLVPFAVSYTLRCCSARKQYKHVTVGAQVMDVCRGVNPRLRVLRARFSALIPRELALAMERLGPPNQLDALAVDARQEIDLRIGASFTRFQTLLLQARRDVMQSSSTVSAIVALHVI